MNAERLFAAGALLAVTSGAMVLLASATRRPSEPKPVEVYYPLRRVFGHRLAWALERLAAVATGRKLCDVCGDTARFTVVGLPHCRPCAWNANGGEQPDDDPDDEPPGAGADPWGRPDPATSPEYWTE